MRKLLFLTLLFAVLLISEVSTQKTKKRRVRVEKKPTPAPIVEETPPAAAAVVEDVIPLETISTANNNEPRIDQEAKLRQLAEAEGENVNEVDVGEPPEEESPRDPCEDKRCGPGRECLPTEQGKAKCVCMAKCPPEVDNRRRVCSNSNETWSSDCELYRARCLCDENSLECINPINKHVHIEYYGECREMPQCAEEEMLDFPRRMRDWLFNVMRELADRRELSPYYTQLEREAERATNDSRKSVVAAVWKWCDLDESPHDRKVSRHELFPIRAPLMALEHCIAPFLDGCDADNDHRITLKEWGLCLQVPPEEMEEKCDDVREGNMDLNEEGEEEA